MPWSKVSNAFENSNIFIIKYYAVVRLSVPSKRDACTQKRKRRQGDNPDIHWRRWSLSTLKLVFNVSGEYQGCHPDDLSVSVHELNTCTPPLLPGFGQLIQYKDGIFYVKKNVGCTSSMIDTVILLCKCTHTDAHTRACLCIRHVQQAYILVCLHLCTSFERVFHDDVIKWKHFPRNWTFVRSRWIPHTKASDAELWCFLWSAHNGEAGDLRRHRGHYDVIVMPSASVLLIFYDGLCQA